MAKTTTKKKPATAAKRAAAKPAPRKPAPKAKPAARKPALAAKKSAPKKPLSKAKPAAKPLSKAKPAPAKSKAAPKPVAKPAPKPMAKPAPKPAPKAAAKPEPKPVPAAKPATPAAKRPVAVSHRPQAAVAVQPRPVKAAAAPARPRAGEHSGVAAPGVLLTEDQIRRAPDSAYMNDSQLAFFQERLLQMRSEVLTRELDVKERLHQREVFADPADRASAEEEHWLDLRLRERESLLLKKIDDALRRIRDKDYGWCEKTGEPIGIARLLARPTATVCVDIKGQDERAESQFRDR
jgi:DnaK suppressor protein